MTEGLITFFFGLVLCSIAVPWAKIEKKGFREVALVLFSALVFFFLFSLKPYEFATLPHPLYFFVGGILGICAMILPGISGSLIFLMMGIYEFIMSHVSNLTRLNIVPIELLNLLLVSLGIILGFSVFVRFLKKGLSSYPSIIFAILTGIIIASLRVLWPYSDAMNFAEISILFFMNAAGFGVVFFLRKLS